MAERIMIALTEKGVGRQEAHESVRELSQKAFAEKKSLREMLEASLLGKKFSKKELDSLFDPSTYIGDAEKIVEDAVK